MLQLYMIVTGYLMPTLPILHEHAHTQSCKTWVAELIARVVTQHSNILALVKPDNQKIQ